MGTVFLIIVNGNLNDAANARVTVFTRVTFFAFRTSYTRVTFFAFHTISNNGCCCSAVAVANGKSMGTIIIIGYRYCRALTVLTINVRHINLNCTIRIILNYSIGTIHNICVVFNNCFCWST